jgi:hypothetical protein
MSNKVHKLPGYRKSGLTLASLLKKFDSNTMASWTPLVNAAIADTGVPTLDPKAIAKWPKDKLRLITFPIGNDEMGGHEYALCGIDVANQNRDFRHIRAYLVAREMIAWIQHAKYNGHSDLPPVPKHKAVIKPAKRDTAPQGKKKNLVYQLPGYRKSRTTVAQLMDKFDSQTMGGWSTLVGYALANPNQIPLLSEGMLKQWPKKALQLISFPFGNAEQGKAEYALASVAVHGDKDFRKSRVYLVSVKVIPHVQKMKFGQRPDASESNGTAPKAAPEAEVETEEAPAAEAPEVEAKVEEAPKAEAETEKAPEAEVVEPEPKDIGKKKKSLFKLGK